MNDTEQIVVLLAAVAAGFFLGMGWANKQRTAQAASADAPMDGSMAWFLNYGSGVR